MLDRIRQTIEEMEQQELADMYKVLYSCHITAMNHAYKLSYATDLIGMLMKLCEIEALLRGETLKSY